MLIFELTYPGRWLDYDDQDWTAKTELNLINLRYQFTDANIALNLFLSASQKKPASEAEKQWKRDETRRNKITRELQEAVLKDPLDYRERIEVAFQAELKFKREKWSSGFLPREFDYQGVLMHARSFLYALHGFDRDLKVLANTDSVPETVQDAYAKYGEAFASLRCVEKTNHKLESQERGLGAGKKVMLPKAGSERGNIIVSSTTRTTKLNYLNGTIYGNTMPDGQY